LVPGTEEYRYGPQPPDGNRSEDEATARGEYPTNLQDCFALFGPMVERARADGQVKRFVSEWQPLRAGAGQADMRIAAN
jgi:hypothetical protein